MPRAPDTESMSGASVMLRNLSGKTSQVGSRCADFQPSLPILGFMFELEVRQIFSAAHALLLRGEREVLHGHDWQVDLTVAADHLDADELAFDFHRLEQTLDEVLQPFQSANLNETPPFDRINPSAEAVARHVAQEVGRRLPESVRVHAVRVTEAPGCAARFIPCVVEAPCR